MVAATLALAASRSTAWQRRERGDAKQVAQFRGAVLASMGRATGRGFLAGLSGAGCRAALTANVTYRALQQWFRWIIDEEKIESSTMARMHPTIVPEQPVPVLTMDQLRALLTSCKSDAVLDGIHVLGTGRRGLALPFGQKTGVALGRYLRVRACD